MLVAQTPADAMDNSQLLFIDRSLSDVDQKLDSMRHLLAPFLHDNRHAILLNESLHLQRSASTNR
jgi:hypothetical protein